MWVGMIISRLVYAWLLAWTDWLASRLSQLHRGFTHLPWMPAALRYLRVARQTVLLLLHRAEGRVFLTLDRRGSFVADVSGGWRATDRCRRRWQRRPYVCVRCTTHDSDHRPTARYCGGG